MRGVPADPPLLQVAKGVPTDPPLVATLPVAANPTVAAPNISECLHELHLDVWSPGIEAKAATCWLQKGLVLRQEQKLLQRTDVHHGIAAML